MIAMEAVLLAAALTGAGDTVLLDFTMDHCGACVQMEPTVRSLRQAGLPVRKINLTHSPMWARHYQVDAAPTFVMISNGREVDRVVGATSYARLKQMFDAAGLASPNRVAAPSKPRSPAPQGNATDVGSEQQTPEQTAINATVRIKVEDPEGNSYGTGTIVDVHDGEALVLTCGHLFRDSRGKGRILVDFNFAGQQRTVAGRLISFDSEFRDIAALMIRPGVAVNAAKVAPPSYRSRVGAAAFSVGCDRGADPSLRRSRITAVNKYVGAPNIEAAGHPIDGRSGGGLFSGDGMLIGVCNAADPQNDEGLYAALATIQWQLDQIGQSRVYRQNDSLLVDNSRRAEPARPQTATSRLANYELPSMPNRMPASEVNQPLVAVTPRGAHTTPVANRLGQGDNEIIVVIRSKSNPRAGETIVVSNPSPQLLAQIRQHNISDSEAYASRDGADSVRNARNPSPVRNGPVIRAQSD